MYFCDILKYRHFPQTQVGKQWEASSAQGLQGQRAWDGKEGLRLPKYCMGEATWPGSFLWKYQVPLPEFWEQLGSF